MAPPVLVKNMRQELFYNLTCQFVPYSTLVNTLSISRHQYISDFYWTRKYGMFVFGSPTIWLTDAPNSPYPRPKAACRIRSGRTCSRSSTSLKRNYLKKRVGCWTGHVNRVSTFGSLTGVRICSETYLKHNTVTFTYTWADCDIHWISFTKVWGILSEH